MSRAERIVAAARAMIGTPFRLHGRGRDGVDCIGLALASLGEGVRGPLAYGLRSGDVARARLWMDEAGLMPVADGVPGDVALAQVGPMQLHVMIHVPGGFVHAHAGIGRVVEMPGPGLWPIIGHWRHI